MQSWLAELAYGVAERLAGIEGIVVLNAVLFAVVAGLIAHLARAGSASRTFVAAGAAIAVGVAHWSPRPLMFGLLAFALVVLVVERERSAWWLLPIGWIWVNTHGSFTLGLVWFAAAFAGSLVDRRRSARLARYGAIFVLGIVAGALNPLGPKLLLFPFSVLTQRESFEFIVEWQAPDFRGVGGVLSLVAIAVAAAVLARGRPDWSRLLPAVAFLALGLYSQRNLAPASIAVAPALAASLAVRPLLGSMRSAVDSAIAAVIAAAAAVFLVGAVTGPGLDLERYPVDAVARLDQSGLRGADDRLVHQDVVGGFLILRDGEDARVFIDDRVDMYPLPVVRDYRRLLQGDRRSLAILDRWRADAVLWDRALPLAAILDGAREWQRAFGEDSWVVYVRR